jgi:hypothetical protein
MSSPAPNVPITLVDAGARPDPTPKVGSITYDRQENGYNLEWETRDDFQRWLSREQQALGIEIRLAKTRLSKVWQVYLTCETFRCARNKLGGTKSHVKTTTRERKIPSKRLEGGCPCYVQIKTYPGIDTILGKYNFNHSHETGKNNLKYIRIRVSTRDLIEDWVRYGVTDQEIVSDPPFDRFRSD